MHFGWDELPWENSRQACSTFQACLLKLGRVYWTWRAFVGAIHIYCCTNANLKSTWTITIFAGNYNEGVPHKNQIQAFMPTHLLQTFDLVLCIQVTKRCIHTDLHKQLLWECKHCCTNNQHNASDPIGQLLSPKPQLFEQENAPEASNEEASLHDCRWCGMELVICEPTEMISLPYFIRRNPQARLLIIISSKSPRHDFHKQAEVKLTSLGKIEETSIPSTARLSMVDLQIWGRRAAYLDRQLPGPLLGFLWRG